MAEAIGGEPQPADLEQRRRYHLAAVFASNYTTQMLVMAKEVLDREKLDFDLLKPLVVQSVNKILDIGPEQALTGPAKRRDYATLEAHKELLDFNENLAEIYEQISQYIIESQYYK
ncbi:MAG: DUF2520 domain-containing protein [Cytophagales bacterium]|nr:DUF2520 domain-containing protein [Cytophagales bacterium]